MPIQTDWLEMSGRRRQARPGPECGPDWAIYWAWAAAFDRWLETLNDLTLHTMKKAWRDFLTYTDQFPWTVQPADVEKWIAFLERRGYAPNTVKKCCNYLSMFYSFARRYVPEGGEAGAPLASTNPVLLAKRPAAVSLIRKGFGETRPLHPSEVCALFEHIDRYDNQMGLRDYALLLTMLATGRTPNQLRRLRWGDFERTAQREVRFCWQDKVGRQHWEALPRLTWQVLYEYLDISGRLCGLLPRQAELTGLRVNPVRLDPIRPQDYIFTPVQDVTGRIDRLGPPDWRRSRPLSINCISRNLNMYADWAGLLLYRRSVTPTALRHTNVLLRYAAGQDLDAIQSALKFHSKKDVRKIVERWPELLAADWTEVREVVGL